MILSNVQFLVLLLCGIRLSFSQQDMLSTPWVDTITLPEKVVPSPIAINSSNVIPVANTFNRFVSIQGGNNTMVNTGKYLIISAATNDTGTYVIGGAVGLSQYVQYGIVFLWNLQLGNAGSTIDGVGTPLEIVLIHLNTNNSPGDASYYRDGWFIYSLPVKVVKGVGVASGFCGAAQIAPDNKHFTSFANKIRKVTKAGTNVAVTGDDLKWYNQLLFVPREYCYPGTLTNPARKNGYSATVCVRLPQYQPIISESQFINAFEALRNPSNKPYSCTRKSANPGPNMPIGSFGPVVIGYEP